MQRFNEKNYGTADSSSNKIHFDEFDDKTRFGKQSVMHRKSRPISKVNSMNLKNCCEFLHLWCTLEPGIGYGFLDI